MFVILFSSCARLLPQRRGYNQLPTSSRGRGSREEENGEHLILLVRGTTANTYLGLIDQYDDDM